MVLPLSKLVVFERGGRLVWSKDLTNKGVRGDPINVLIQTVLLEEKGGKQCFEVDAYRVEWRLVNECEIIIACIYEAALDVSSAANDTLEALRSAVLSEYTSKGVGIEQDALERRYPGLEKYVESKQRLAVKEVEKKEIDTSVEETISSTEKPNKNNKKRPTWHESKKKISKAEADQLDYSKKTETTTNSDMAAYMPEAGEVAAWDEDENDDLDILEEDITMNTTQADVPEKKGMLSQLKAWTTGSRLTEAEVEPVMEELRERLVSKNVASEIALEITQSVSTQLCGKQVERFTRPSNMVKQALIDAVERVLTPKTSTDVLGAVLRRKAETQSSKRPYIIVFVGINGVGKSTTLSKVAYYLKAHGATVSIAACDTFRSGAVEQLRRHADSLQVDLFQRGYLKDPADVARAAIDHATKAKHDVVLVDTAGRMQNNDKLMKQLAKLIATNNPDLVLFVGEALVGNDGIDQLNMFHSSLKHFANEQFVTAGGAKSQSEDSASTTTRRRPVGIDGLVLTKFDCIDDKVGAVLSMTYKTGQPVCFIGVGQKYTHLKKLSVNSVVTSLFRR